MSISQLNEKIYAWVIRVVVVEKSLIRHAHYMGRKYQRYVFADDLVSRNFFFSISFVFIFWTYGTFFCRLIGFMGLST